MAPPVRPAFHRARPTSAEDPGDAGGRCFVGHKIFPDRKLVRSEFFNDFLRPQGFFHIMGGVPIKGLTLTHKSRLDTAKPLLERIPMVLLRTS